ncbi:MAG: hypothetical protein V3T17_13910 [Pseudomonadales bacterium]
MQKMQEQFSVIGMDAMYAENAGAIFCHHMGDTQWPQRSVCPA